MSSFFQPFFIVIAIPLLVNAQSEEAFYSFEFDPNSDWIEYKGTIYQKDYPPYEPIQWVSDNPNCPRARNQGGSGTVSEKKCLLIKPDAFISRVISTVGYHSIHVQIDTTAKSADVYENEWCYIGFRTDSIGWTQSNIVQGETVVKLDFNLNIPDDSTYNNEAAFEIKVGIDADEGGDNCLFDNLRVFGIPDTQNPTKDPTKSPTQPPTKYPSIHPTTNTIAPTKDPTFNPTNAPTFNPTEELTTEESDTTDIETDDQALYSESNNTLFWVLFISILVCCLCVCGGGLLYLTGERKIKQSVTMMKRTRQDVAMEKRVKPPLPPHMRVKESDSNIIDEDIVMSELGIWLRDVVELPMYYDMFSVNGYTMESVKGITDKATLRQIGITKLGHQTRIISEIEKIPRAEGDKTTATDDGDIYDTRNLMRGQKQQDEGEPGKKQQDVGVTLGADVDNPNVNEGDIVL